MIKGRRDGSTAAPPVLFSQFPQPIKRGDPEPPGRQLHDSSLTPSYSTGNPLKLNGFPALCPFTFSLSLSIISAGLHTKYITHILCRKERDHMTDESRAARNAYRREWAKNNPDKVRAQQLRYWQRRAAAAEAAAGDPQPTDQAAPDQSKT